MLNSLPPSPAILPPPPAACPPIPRRKRGAQPANRNALHHGLFAVQHPTPLTAMLPSITAFRRIPDKSPQLLPQLILELQHKADLGLQFTLLPGDWRSDIACFNLTVRTLKLIARLRLTQFSQSQPLRDLLVVSKHAHDLLGLDFHRSGISRDADSFREKDDLSDFNSPFFRQDSGLFFIDPQIQFISPRQWRVLEPLLPPSQHSGGRGRPPVDPRLLLDAVFWKFAHHARWQDLPGYYPPMLTCRRYYSRLYRSGRLATLYAALYKDFCARGRAGLVAHVRKGCFILVDNKVTLSPSCDDTWQARTALLFIQQGLQVLHAILRENMHAHSLKLPTPRRLLKKEALQPYIPLDLSEPGLYQRQ